MKGRLALYARVSGHEQDKSETIETQRYWLEKWAADQKWEVVGWYADADCQSWIPVAEREEGGRLLRDAARKRFDAVAIYKLGRWSRYLEVWREGQRDLKKLGIDLICINESTDDDKPGERFSLGVKLLVNEYERDNLAGNCLDGRYRRVSEGGYVGGVVPFGYRVIDENRRRRLAIDEDEAETIRLIYRLLVHERMAALAIARHLNALGIPTASARLSIDGRHRPQLKGNPQWHAGRLCEMIRNPIYCGRGEFGGAGPRGQVLFDVPAIVDPELWEAAQLQLKANRKGSPRNQKRVYLLSGLLYCEDCRRTLLGHTEAHHGRTYTYYKCPGRVAPPQGRGYCPLPYLRAEQIEADLWERLVYLIEHHEETAHEMRRTIVNEAARSEGLQASCDGIRAAILKKHEALERAVTLATDGFMTREQLQRQQARLDAQIAELEQEQTALLQQVAEAREQEQRIAAAQTRLVAWADRLAKPLTPADQREMIEGLVAGISLTWDGERVHSRYRLAVDPASHIVSPTCSRAGNNMGILLSLAGPTWTRRAA